jgi:hypothetical protein
MKRAERAALPGVGAARDAWRRRCEATAERRRLQAQSNQ